MKNKKATKHTATIQNFYALIAVILNEDLDVDEAIRYFNL